MGARQFLHDPVEHRQHAPLGGIVLDPPVMGGGIVKAGDGGLR